MLAAVPECSAFERVSYLFPDSRGSHVQLRVSNYTFLVCEPPACSSLLIAGLVSGADSSAGKVNHGTGRGSADQRTGQASR